MWQHPGLNSWFFSPLKVLFFLLQVQASWLQHDLGHLSAFRMTKWNHLLHKFVMCHLIVSPWKTSEGFPVKMCVLKTPWSMWEGLGSGTEGILALKVLFMLCSSLEQGASAKWWTLLHSQHHAKPNCFHKDPDIDMHPFLFTLGKKFSVEVSVWVWEV